MSRIFSKFLPRLLPIVSSVSVAAFANVNDSNPSLTNANTNDGANNSNVNISRSHTSGTNSSRFSTKTSSNKSPGPSGSDPDDCETPICKDAQDAISDYGSLLSRRRGSSSPSRSDPYRIHSNQRRRDGSYNYTAFPPDRQELGRNTWTLLHSMAAYYPEHPSEDRKDQTRRFLKLLSEIYPCHVCASDLKRLLEEMPPRLENREEFVRWMCELHNDVNRQLNKPQFDCNKCDLRWRRSNTSDWKDIMEMEEEGDVEYDD